MKRFLKKKFLGIPLFAILAVTLTGIVVLAVTVISNLWVSPDIDVTVEPVPPANKLLVISSPDFTEPSSAYTNQWFYADVQTVNPSPSGAPGYNSVLIQFAICKTTQIAVTDVVLEYQAVVGGDWLPLTLTLSDGKLVGTFGPADGFPVGYNYDETTPLRAKFTTVGTYHAEAQATGSSN